MNQKKWLTSLILTLCVLILPKKCSGEISPQLMEYAQLVQRRVNSVAIYPYEAQEMGLEGVVKLNLIILSDGQIKDLSIAESSGSSLLDEAVITAVEEASPYPSLQDYTGLEKLELIVTVFYEKPKAPTTELPEEITVKVPTAAEVSKGLEEFIELALENHQPARIAQEQVELARLKIYKAQRDLFPTLVGEWKEVDGKTITDPYRGRSYGLQGEQTLFDSGKLLYTLRREKLGLEIAEKNYNKIKNDLTLKVKKAYYELARSKKLLEKLKETLAEAEKDLGLVKRQYNAGLITEIELLSAQSKYERLGYFINSAEADLSLAKLNFQQALNVDSTEALELEPKVDFDLEVNQIKIDPEEALEEAQRSRPDIQVLELGSSSSEYAELIAARENRPKLSLVGSLGRSGEAYATEPLDMVNEWSIMGKVSWLWGGSTLETSATTDKVLSKKISDTTLKTESETWSTKFSLLNNLSFYSDKKEAQIAHQQTLNELNELQQKTAAEVKDAYFSYQKALSQLNLSMSEMGFREKELVVRSMRRDLGELPTSEVMEGRIELAQAKSTHIQAIANYYLSLASLNKAIGISDYYR